LPKYRDLNYHDVLPASWTDAIQEFISTGLYNFALVQIDNVTIQVPAATGDGQAAIGINGLFRWNTANVNTAHPGGAAGQYDVYVTTGDNVFSNSPSPDTDLTDYTFGLIIKPLATPPAAPHYRKIGQVTWDGSKITGITLIPGLPKHVATHLPGGTDPLPADGVAGVATLRTLGSGAQQAVAGNDTRIPTQPENDALVGTTGSPSSGNKYVTDSDPRLVAPGVPPNHALRHQPGGADQINYSTINMSGVLSARPAASASLAGCTYLATDVNGGTLYECNGTAWLQSAAPVTLPQQVAQFVTLAQFAALTPTDDMRVILQIDAANGINWPLRYNASSASPYKWEALGEGTALYSRSHAVGFWKPITWPFVEGSTDTGWSNAIGSYVGPSIAVPRNGEYYVKFGAHGWIDYFYYPYYLGPHPDAPTGAGWMSLNGCGIVPDDDQLVCYFPHLHPSSPYRVRKLTLTAGTIAAVWRAYAYNVGYFLRLYAQDRTLEVVPIRIQ
jgi:hypothetical protein